MPVYFVQISGSGIRGTFGGESLVCGFVKNEYVFASSPEIAKDKAIANVERKLRKKTNLNADDVQETELTIGHVESGFRWLSVLREDGFVFHPIK